MANATTWDAPFRSWSDQSIARFQRTLIAAQLAAAFIGMLGGTWDAAWHVTLVRETFWSPPHLLLYAGTTISLIVGCVALSSAWLFGWRMPGPEVRLGRPLPLGFLVMAAGAFVVIGAAPLDDWWHNTFGRDVDVWSPPHIVALVGGVTISLGSVLAVGADMRRLGGRPHGDRLLTAGFLTVLLWASMFSLNWYTLVLAAFRDSIQYPILASLVGAPALVLASMALGRGGATCVSMLYMVYTVAAHAFLASRGFALLPFPPAVIGPAIVVDALFWRGPRPSWRRGLLAAALFAPAFYVVEAASLAWYPHPALPAVPTSGPALRYYEAVLARPWDALHILEALPFATAVGAASGSLGWCLGAVVQWTQGLRPFSGRGGGMAQPTRSGGRLAIERS